MAYIGTSPSQGVRNRFIFTATSGQTTFSGSDDDGRTLSYTDTKFMDVYLNGVLLDPNSDYTATSGSSIVLTSGAATSDILEVLAFDTFSVFSGTFGGDVTVGGAFTSQGIDDNATATAVTLDSSGNLLVGKTSSSFSVAGIGLMANDQIFATASSDNSLALNRLSTDGEIAKFYKDSTAVGSISTIASTMYLGTGDVNLRLGASTDIRPAYSTGLNRDNAIDLGTSAARFKDLYLGGSVYLGGTTSANALDDYEEGTWTPSVVTGTVSGSDGYYIKTGNKVHVRGRIYDFSDISSAIAVTINGLPFTPNSNTQLGGAGSCMMNYNNIGPHTTYMTTSGIILYASASSNANYVSVLHNNIYSTSARVYFQATYYVN